MAEWSKALAWRASVSAMAPWVRIPLLPQIYNFRILGRDCLAASPLGRSAARAKAPFCNGLPRSAWRKGNGLVLDLEVRFGEAKSKTKFC